MTFILSIAICSNIYKKPQNTIALMPLLNLSEKIKAPELIEPMVDDILSDRGYKIIPSGQLRDILRKYRIRNIGQVAGPYFNQFRERHSIDYLGIISVDIFEETGIPELSLTFRIVEIQSMLVTWSRSVSSTGEDHTVLFQIGKIQDIDALIPECVSRLFSEFPERLKQENPSKSRIKIGLVPFENLSNNPYSPKIVENILLSSLYGVKADLFEPGILVSYFNNNQVSPIGEIDLNTLKGLHFTYNLDYVITGAIDHLQFGGANYSQLNPSLEWTVKLLNCKTGKIDGIWHQTEEGRQGKWLFQLGKEISIGRLIGKASSKLIKGRILKIITTREEL